MNQIRSAGLWPRACSTGWGNIWQRCCINQCIFLTLEYYLQYFNTQWKCTGSFRADDFCTVVPKSPRWALHSWGSLFRLHWVQRRLSQNNPGFGLSIYFWSISSFILFPKSDKKHRTPVYLEKEHLCSYGCYFEIIKAQFFFQRGISFTRQFLCWRLMEWTSYKQMPSWTTWCEKRGWWERMPKTRLGKCCSTRLYVPGGFHLVMILSVPSWDIGSNLGNSNPW